MKEKPPEPEYLIPPELAAGWEETAKEWQKNPEELEKWLEHEMLVQLQINAAIASGKINVGGGRTGANILARSLVSFGTIAERVLSALRRPADPVA